MLRQAPLFDHQFNEGLLVVGRDTFFIRESTINPANAQQVDLKVVGRPYVIAGTQVRVTDDDWEPGGALNPIAPSINPFNIPQQTMFGLMQASPDLAMNRYAAAYIQPEYGQLRPFNTARANPLAGARDNPVPALTHFQATFSRGGGAP